MAALGFWVLVGIFLAMANSAIASIVRPSFQALTVEQTGRLICRVTAFGAIGNGIAYDTNAIQSSINFCANRGGGVVHIPPGTYLTGTIRLRSNVTLWVDPGATLMGSTRQEDFGAPEKWYTILAEDAHNVEVTGGGIVTGQGLKFVVEFKEEKNIMVSWNETGGCEGDECRPRLVGFLNCKNVHVWNVHLQEPAYWCLHIVNSDAISIHNVSINGDFNSPNTDGIDIESSNNTVITDCRIDTGDDAICPKTSDAGPLYNLTVTNCWIRTKSCAVKLGSRTDSDLRNLHFENLVIVDSHRGLGIQLRDQGNVHNVTYANIHMSTRYYNPSWWGLAEPIYVTACPRTAHTVVGVVSNVRYINISATSENGIFLSGSGKEFLQGLQFTNVNVTLVRTTNFTGGYHDYRPGCEGMVKHRMAGVFMENVDDVWMEKVRVQWKRAEVEDWGLPFEFTPSTVHEMHLVNFENTFVD